MADKMPKVPAPARGISDPAVKRIVEKLTPSNVRVRKWICCICSVPVAPAIGKNSKRISCRLQLTPVQQLTLLHELRVEVDVRAFDEEEGEEGLVCCTPCINSVSQLTDIKHRFNGLGLKMGKAVDTLQNRVRKRRACGSAEVGAACQHSKRANVSVHQQGQSLEVVQYLVPVQQQLQSERAGVSSEHQHQQGDCQGQVGDKNHGPDANGFDVQSTKDNFGQIVRPASSSSQGDSGMKPSSSASTDRDRIVSGMEPTPPIVKMIQVPPNFLGSAPNAGFQPQMQPHQLDGQISGGNNGKTDANCGDISLPNSSSVQEFYSANPGQSQTFIVITGGYSSPVFNINHELVGVLTSLGNISNSNFMEIKPFGGRGNECQECHRHH